MRLYECAVDRLRHANHATSRFGGTVRRRALPLVIRGFTLRGRHAEEGPGLLSDFLEVYQAAAFADDAEEIAMFAGRCVGPFAGRTLGVSLSRT
jgi:hypothetical protein